MTDSPDNEQPVPESSPPEPGASGGQSTPPDPVAAWHQPAPSGMTATLAAILALLGGFANTISIMAAIFVALGSDPGEQALAIVDNVGLRVALLLVQLALIGALFTGAALLFRRHRLGRTLVVLGAATAFVLYLVPPLLPGVTIQNEYSTAQLLYAIAFPFGTLVLALSTSTKRWLAAST